MWKLKRFFKKSEHKKYACWAVAVIVGLLFVLIGRVNEAKLNQVPKEKTTIYVKAPEDMKSVFKDVIIKTSLNKDYEIEFTNEENKANFTVKEGLKNDGELIAYSPIIAVFNGSDETFNEYKEKELFVKSDINNSDYDFDFKKVIDEILFSQNSEFKIYYPSQNSTMWDEFYSFLLFTVNDGYYPKEGTDMEEAVKNIEDFFNSRNAEPIDNYNIRIMNGISKNSIYFMTYADLAHLDKNSSQKKNSFRIMYPKTVVYHNYYAKFDEIGLNLYNALGKSTWIQENVGYYYLEKQYYNTKYSFGVPNMSTNIQGERTQFNSAEIPIKTTTNILKEEE